MFFFGVTGDKPEDSFICFIDTDEPGLPTGGGIDSLRALRLIRLVGFDTGLIDEGWRKGETETGLDS